MPTIDLGSVLAAAALISKPEQRIRFLGEAITRTEALMDYRNQMQRRITPRLYMDVGHDTTLNRLTRLQERLERAIEDEYRAIVRSRTRSTTEPPLEQGAQPTPLKEATTEPRVLRAAEAAAYLNVSVSTLGKKARAGEIPYTQPGGKLRFFLTTDLDEWARSHRKVSRTELREQIETEEMLASIRRRKRRR